VSADNGNLGGGSGGGCDKSNDFHRVDGNFTREANQLQFSTWVPISETDDADDPCVITLLAVNFKKPTDGFVNIRGQAGVRVTAGIPPKPAVASDSTNGAEILVGQLQNVTIKRGLIPEVDQVVEMTPDGITVDGGSMPVTVQSKTKIVLSVADGATTITLDPKSITLSVGEGTNMITLDASGITLAANCSLAGMITMGSAGESIQGAPKITVQAPMVEIN